MRSYCNCSNNSCSTPDIFELAALLKIAGEQNRLRLLCILRDGGEHCVCEFGDHAADLSQSLISHHLADLKKADLITSEKRGLNVHYSLTERGKLVIDTLFSLNNKETATMKEPIDNKQNCCCASTKTSANSVCSCKDACTCKECGYSGNCTDSKNCNQDSCGKGQCCMKQENED